MSNATGLIGRGAHRWFRTPREVAHLRASDEPALAAIGAACDAVLTRNFSDEELARFREVEGLRTRLLASRGRVEWTDYGAGDGGEACNADEMRRGRYVADTVAAVCRRASKPPRWGRLLFRLVRELRPAACLELGTCLGISAAYQAMALAMNGVGRLVTVEGAGSLARLAERNLEGLGLDRAAVRVGRFEDVLDDVLRTLAPVDFAFVDGHHDEGATVAYLERLLPDLAPRALVVFDDIAWSAGMRMAWRRIRTHPRVLASVDLFSVGLCIVGGRPARRQEYRIALT